MSYEAPLPVHERFTAPNGAPIDIYRENGTDFVRLVDIVCALGYSRSSTGMESIKTALRNSGTSIYAKNVCCGKQKQICNAYFIPSQKVVPFLTAFRKYLTTSRPCPDLRRVTLHDNAYREAQKLICEFADLFKWQDIRGQEEPTMKSNYDLRETKRITTPNGTTLRVFTDGVNEFVQTTTIARALGYSAFVVDNSLLALVFKNNNFHLYTKPMQGGKPTYFNKTTQVIPILQAFIRLALMTRQTNPAYLAKIDDARMEAERLIPVFKREILGEPCEDEISTNDNQEATQMENNEIQTTVPVVTATDIEDINERAEAVTKVFGVSKVDALRAVTKLKAQEINRDLQPLLELLDK